MGDQPGGVVLYDDLKSTPRLQIHCHTLTYVGDDMTSRYLKASLANQTFFPLTLLQPPFLPYYNIKVAIAEETKGEESLASETTLRLLAINSRYKF